MAKMEKQVLNWVLFSIALLTSLVFLTILIIASPHRWKRCRLCQKHRFCVDCAGDWFCRKCG